MINAILEVTLVLLEVPDDFFPVDLFDIVLPLSLVDILLVELPEYSLSVGLVVIAHSLIQISIASDQSAIPERSLKKVIEKKIREELQ